MANTPNTDRKIAIIGALSEGSSIRSIKRITGVHRDTIMRLGVKVEQACTTFMGEKMHTLSPVAAVRAFIVQEFRANAASEA